MKRSRFRESPTTVILEEVELYAKFGKACHKHGLNEPTHYKEKSRHAGMTVSHLG